MITVYGVHRSRASRNIWMLHELGVPFEVKPVIQAYRLLDRPPGLPPVNTRSPEFLRLNPLGQIPVVTDGDLVLTESLGINLYLARKYGVASGLGPVNVEEEGQMLTWSFRAAKEYEDRALDILMHRASLPAEDREPAVAQMAEAVMRDRFPLISAALARTGYLVGGRFTVADLNLAEVLRYATPARELFDDNPTVKDWLSRCQDRPAFKQMWADRDKEPA